MLSEVFRDVYGTYRTCLKSLNIFFKPLEVIFDEITYLPKHAQKWQNPNIRPPVPYLGGYMMSSKLTYKGVKNLFRDSKQLL